jgi:hypothetical protein
VVVGGIVVVVGSVVVVVAGGAVVGATVVEGAAVGVVPAEVVASPASSAPQAVATSAMDTTHSRPCPRIRCHVMTHAPRFVFHASDVTGGQRG